MTTRVVVVDDQPLVRVGLTSLIDHDPALTVVGEAGDGAEAVAEIVRLRPDVVLMDVRMPGVDGLTATEQIAADPELAATKVIILTTYEIDDYLFRALEAGASGFLLKSIEPGDLRRAVQLVAKGQALLDPAVTLRVIQRFSRAGTRPHADPRRLDVLTAREREVVQLVAQGLTNDEIGDQLYISPLTAKTHVNRSMAKLNARDRAQLVVTAFQLGLAR